MTNPTQATPVASDMPTAATPIQGGKTDGATVKAEPAVVAKV
jgi:hypothetical protein